MATLKYQDKEFQLEDNSKIEETCKDLGVPFNCKNGTCGTCIVEVTQGEDNLSDLNEKEKSLALDKTHRLACQCKIKSGEVEVDF